jgi:S-sulfosulfanyl-L-cysteine sulfohydrolase
MLTRREFVSVAAATMASIGYGDGGRTVVAQQRLDLDRLLRFEPLGQLTLLHMTDCHAQLAPLYYREASVNLGVGEMAGLPPHLTGAEAIKALGITPGSPEAYALTSADFEALARTYGRVGGMDRLATVVNAIRAERGSDRCLLLDGGDALQGSYSALKSEGWDMVRVLDALGVEATTGHWEFTLGADRVQQLYGNKDRPGLAKAAFLAANVRDIEFEEPVFKGWQMFEKGGLLVAVIGQSFPYTAIAHPRRMVPKWWFGIREAAIWRLVTHVRKAGADVVVLLSHNGFDVDRKLAGRVPGIDVILSGHTHDALPQPTLIGRTLVVASGSHGKFLSRLDLDVRAGEMVGWRHALIPILADAIPPEAGLKRLIEEIRAPDSSFLATELARTETTLWRRGNFGGTLDHLICDALISERDAEISLSPGFRWGGTLLPGQAITWEDVYNATAITYPTAYRTTIRGAFLRTILEDVADNLFNPDPYYQQGGDMVRVGGLSFVIRPDADMGERISDLTLSRTGQPIESDKSYVVTGWGSLNEGVDGPPIWDVLAQHLRTQKIVTGVGRQSVTVKRG